MKLKTKMLLFMSFIIIITVLTIVLHTNSIIEKSEKKLLDTYKNNRMNVIHNYVLQSSQELRNRIYDNAYWDDAFYYLEEKNTEWLKENITQYLYEEPTFYIDLLLLRKNDGTYTEIYGEHIAVNDLISTQVYEKALHEKKINKEYINIKGKTYEIFAAPIMTTDKEKRTNGILLLGRAVNEDFLMNLSKFLTMENREKISIVNEYTRSNNFNDHKYALEIYYPIKDINGKDLAWIKVVDDISIFRDSKYLIFRQIAIVIMFYSFLAGSIVIIFIHKMIHKTEKVITQINSIAQGNYKDKLEENGPSEMVKLAKSVNKLSKEIEMRIKEQENNYLESVKILVASLEVKDEYTKGHSERVAFYAYHLGEAIGYEKLDTLMNAALVHDIGKIAIPEVILNKPGKLTDEEYEIIKKHPDMGYKILDASHMFKDIKDIIKYHHERYDGKGYPKGLCGENIPLGARILAIADVFDALTSDRSYREAMSVEKAMKIITKDSGTHFDPFLVEAFEGIVYKLYKKVEL